MSKTLLLLDTDVWLGIAEDPRRAPLLAVIEVLLQRQALELLVPETVLDEFLNLRHEIENRATKEWAKSLKTVRETLPIVKISPKTLSIALSHLNEVARHLHVFGSSATMLLDRVQSLIAARAVPNSPNVKQKAVTRVTEGRAPCHHRGKNTLADALILETYIEAVASANANAHFIFVTHNKSDFSSESSDKREPHDDLAPVFDGLRSKFFIDLDLALRAVDDEAVNEAILKSDPTVGQLLEQYRLTLSPGTSGHFQIGSLLQLPIADLVASMLSSDDLVEHCELRQSKLKSLRGSTLRNEVSYLRSAFTLAAKTHPNISTAAFTAAAPLLREKNLVGKSIGRTFRPRKADIDRAVAYFEQRESSTGWFKLKYPVAEVLKFTLHSGLKIGEIKNLEWEHIDATTRSARIYGTQRSRHDSEPLTIRFTPEAWAILDRQPTREIRGPVFPMKDHSFSASVRNGIQKDLKITGLTLDDFRREAEIRVYLETNNFGKVLEMTGGENESAVRRRILAALRNGEEKHDGDPGISGA